MSAEAGATTREAAAESLECSCNEGIGRFDGRVPDRRRHSPRAGLPPSVQS